MAQTKIEWADSVWNPISGCTPVSEGCEHCYAKRMAKRLAGRYGYPEDEPFKVTLHSERMNDPLRWRKLRRIFVCSMSDLFHPDVPDEHLARIFYVMSRRIRHTFIILTKRPERMKEFVNGWDKKYGLPGNIWLGVTAENQQRANERIPILLQTPAAIRFVSVEPMLGPVDLTGVQFDRYTVMNVLEGQGINERSYAQSIPNAFCDRLNWVICGGETGPNARPMHPDWARGLRDQCIDAGIPFFFKSWGEWFPRDEWEYNPEVVLPFDDLAYKDGPYTKVFDGWYGTCPVHKVGKKVAGRLMSGREWNEIPK